MSRVFVTGGSGFFGSAIVRVLWSHGHEVAVLQRPDSTSTRLDDIKDQIAVFSGSVNSLDWVRPAVSFQPEIVIHAAWDGVVSKARDDEAQRYNLIGVEASLELSARSGTKKWIGIGSQAEYGVHASFRSEETSTLPNTRYGEAKDEGRKISHFFCDFNNIEFAWVRVYSLYGPNDSPEFLIPFLIEKLLNGEVPDLTEGEQEWDYLYVEDAARAIMGLADTHGATGIFNLGSGKAEVLRTLIEELRNCIEPTLPLGFGNQPYRSDQIFELKADISKLQAAIGWSPSTTWKEGIEETIAWHRELRLKSPN